jgi:hypothetical protein
MEGSISLEDLFQDRVSEVKESGNGLLIVFYGMKRILSIIPDDDDVAKQQRDLRNDLRSKGEVIRLSDIHSGDESQEGEEARQVDVCHTPHGDAPATTTTTTADARTAREEEVADHRSHSDPSESDRHFSSNTRSVLPPSMVPDVRFPADTGDAADSESVCSTSTGACSSSCVEEESTVQLQIFDCDPRGWLLQFICTSTKLFGEGWERYSQQLYTLLNFMSLRRRRIELRSAVLRARQQQERPQGETAATTGKVALFSTTTAMAAAASPTHQGTDSTLARTEAALAELDRGPLNEDGGAGCNSAVSDEEASDTDLSPEEQQRALVCIPDHVLRQRSGVFSHLFSLYAAVVLRGEVPMQILKRICCEAAGVCETLRAYQRDPADIVAQLHTDRAEQKGAFFDQWLTEGEGRLALFMTNLAAEKAESAATSHSISLDASVLSDLDSTVGVTSVMDSEGNSRHDASVDAQEGSALADEEGSKVGREGSSAAVAGTAAADSFFTQSPPVDPYTIMELIDEYCITRTPLTCRLTQLVVETVPGKGRDALLPCIEQPERRGFNDGYVHMAPFMTAEEEALLTGWMQVRLSELPGSFDPVAESALVRAWASPTYDPQAGELTILMNPTNAFRLQLSNPTSFSVNGMQCDMCCLGGRRVSYQAVLESGVRNEVVLGLEDCIGYDICVACSYFYYKSCEVRLLRAVHPNPAVRRPFVYGRYSKIAVNSVTVARVGDGADDAALVVEVVMGVSPFGVLPIGWVLPRNQLAALGRACPLRGDATEEYVELTAAEHAALPVPDVTWQACCRVTNVGKLLHKEDAEDRAGGGVDPEDAPGADVCPICLQLLNSTLPVLRTRCGHWFHVECIGSHYHYKPAMVDGEVNEENGCPICRSPEYMPSLTNVDETLRRNVYRLEMRLPVSADEAPVAVAVGTILTDDGVYHNATNIAACSAFFDLVPGFMYRASDEAATTSSSTP